MKGKLLLVLVLCVMGLLLIGGCKEEKPESGTEEAKSEMAEKKAADEQPAAQPTEEEKVEPKEEKIEGTPVVVFETTMGNFELELNPEKAPITVENFINYVKEGFFNGLIFHRIINSFVIQGGGFDKDMNRKQTKAPIKNEASNGLKNVKYSISMARTNDPNSATSQFFINVADNRSLDYAPGNAGYAVFGKIISGFEVIDKIKAVPTTTKGPYRDVPVEPITMTKVYLKK